MHMQRSYIFFFLLSGMMLAASCRTKLDVQPSHLVPEQKMWTTKNDARSAVFSAYALLRSALADNNAWLVYGELRAGDFTSISRGDLSAVTANQLTASFPALENWSNWRRFYAVIYQANLCLEKLETVHKNDFRYTEEEMKVDLAHVRFLRSLAYFYLVRIWGDVPLVTRAVSGDFVPLERSPQARVLDMAAADALAASEALPWKYDQQSPELRSQYWGQPSAFWQGVIAGKGSAYMLLAHIAAWRGDYLSTDKFARLVIDNRSKGGYAMVNTAALTGNTGVFTGQAEDIIFAMPFNKNYQESSASGHIEEWVLAEPFISKAQPDIFISNDSILRIFDEPNDERFKVNDGGTGVGNYFTGFGNPVPLFSKIRLLSVTGANPLRSYQSAIVVFRYEELLLLRAEALLYLGKTGESAQVLNSVRGQRGIGEYKGPLTALANAILQERRRELLGEGWRWFDLVRFEKLDQYSRFSPADLGNGAQYWPISKSQLSTASPIQQNKYWQQ
jgi:hypothetical protein